MSALTEDAFLSGRVTIRQPRDGYRAGVDPVLLAAAVPARPGERVLELGCGAGTALLCLAARVPGLGLTGVEIAPDMAALAAGNAGLNGVPMDVITADIAALPETLKTQSYDHVMANPPYFDRRRGSPSAHEGRETARAGTSGLTPWVDVMTRRLSRGGTASLIHRAECLPELLSAIDDRLGDITILPLAPRRSIPAKLLILQARKGSNGPFRLLPPLVLHDGDRHGRDGDGYSAAARAVLREGAALRLQR